jgi:type IV pilus assembly protein PilA
MNHQMQKGFTLIELMIVVAIIGILAAVAIPQYQNYIARAQITEPVSLLGAAKTPITEFVASNGAFPTTAQLENLGITDDAAGAIAKAESILKIETGDTGATAGVVTGTLIATLESTGLNAAFTSKTVVLAYNSATGKWVCGTSVVSTEHQLLPSDCRQGKAAAIAAAEPAAAAPAAK